jgi:hypothetical protein
MDLTIIERAKLVPRDVVIVDDWYTQWITSRDELYGWLRDQKIERGLDRSSNRPNSVSLSTLQYLALRDAMAHFNGIRDECGRMMGGDADELIKALAEGGSDYLYVITEWSPYWPDWSHNGMRIRLVRDDGLDVVGTLEDQEELSCEEDNPVYCVRLDDGRSVAFVDVKDWRYEPPVKSDQTAPDRDIPVVTVAETTAPAR